MAFALNEWINIRKKNEKGELYLRMNVQIGNTLLSHGLMLAPMAGVTDRTFRLICRELGAEYTVSEMVSAKALCYEQRAKRKEFASSVTAVLAATTKEESPMAVQLFGCEPDFMAEAAAMIETGSYRGCISTAPPVAIDINMGCPVRKITGNGEGSALMKNPDLAAQIVRAVSDAVSLPVTVQIRAGWDRDSINAPELAKRLEQAGAAVICVHARTREQLYTPGIDLGVIEQVKKSVSIPVIGNGDVVSAQTAKQMLEQTGCDGLMIGRGAMGNPWIFSEIGAMLKGCDYEKPTVSQRFDMARRHLFEMLREKGDRVGLSEAKKHLAWYIVGLNGAASARGRLMTAKSAEEVDQILLSLEQEQDAERYKR